MNSQADVSAPAALAGLRGDRVTYGAVHLGVRDLERSLAFWRDLIGLGELASEQGEARLGADGRALVVLHADATRPAARGHAGLYHVALHVPEEQELARLLVALDQAGVPQSPTDHIYSKVTYVHDPDGIMLELTLETPERFGSLEIGAGTVVMFDSDGRRRGPTEPLDVAEVIAALGEGEVSRPLAAGSYVGHVHLHVPDLRVANDFYRDVIGFQEHAFMEGFGMADLSAGGRFPHRLALNVWNGPGAQQAPPDTAGLRRYELILGEEGRLAEVAAGAASAGLPFSRDAAGAGRLQDPAGNEIALIQGQA